MVTRFYLGDSTPGGTITASVDTWHVPNTQNSLALSTTKYQPVGGNLRLTLVSLTITGTALTHSVQDSLTANFVSSGSTRAGLYGGDIRGVIKAVRHLAGTASTPSRSQDIWFSLVVKVIDNTATQVRGILYNGAGVKHGGSTLDYEPVLVNGDYSTAGSTRLIRQSGNLGSPITLTPVQVSVGDRLVVECGFTLFGTGTATDQAARMWYGADPDYADYAETEGLVAPGASWIEFSDDWFGVACPDLNANLTSSINQSNYNITKGSSALFQYNNTDACAIQAPFIYGVRGARTLRSSHAPHITVNSKSPSDNITGSFVGNR